MRRAIRFSGILLALPVTLAGQASIAASPRSARGRYASVSRLEPASAGTERTTSRSRIGTMSGRAGASTVRCGCRCTSGMEK